MERTGAKAERIYQSGKTRCRNANKKKCLKKLRIMARSVMASNAQNPPIQVVDLDVSTEFPDLSIPVNSIMKANSSDTRVAEHNQTEKVDFPNRTVLSMKETAEVSGNLETILSPMETHESQSVSSTEFYNVQMVEDNQNNYEEDELEQLNHGYTARCIRIKDNTFAYAGQT